MKKGIAYLIAKQDKKIRDWNRIEKLARAAGIYKPTELAALIRANSPVRQIGQHNLEICKIIADEIKESLLSKTNQKEIFITLSNDKITEKDKNFLKKIGSVKILKNKVEIYFDPKHTSMNKIIETIYKTDLKILDLSTKNVRLEEVFVNLIKDN